MYLLVVCISFGFAWFYFCNSNHEPAVRRGAGRGHVWSGVCFRWSSFFTLLVISVHYARWMNCLWLACLDLLSIRKANSILEVDDEGGRMFLRVLIHLVMHEYPPLVSGALQLLFKHFSQRQDVLHTFTQVNHNDTPHLQTNTKASSGRLYVIIWLGFAMPMSILCSLFRFSFWFLSRMWKITNSLKKIWTVCAP